MSCAQKKLLIIGIVSYLFSLDAQPQQSDVFKGIPGGYLDICKSKGLNDHQRSSCNYIESFLNLLYSQEPWSREQEAKVQKLSNDIAAKESELKQLEEKINSAHACVEDYRRYAEVKNDLDALPYDALYWRRNKEVPLDIAVRVLEKDQEKAACYLKTYPVRESDLQKQMPIALYKAYFSERNCKEGRKDSCFSWNKQGSTERECELVKMNLLQYTFWVCIGNCVREILSFDTQDTAQLAEKQYMIMSFLQSKAQRNYNVCHDKEQCKQWGAWCAFKYGIVQPNTK